jgi:hypothetical protein
VRVTLVDYETLPEGLEKLPGYTAPPADMYLLFSETAVAKGYELGVSG